jgi:predicted alpha/beta-fold hydrolase
MSPPFAAAELKIVQGEDALTLYQFNTRVAGTTSASTAGFIRFTRRAKILCSGASTSAALTASIRMHSMPASMMAPAFQPLSWRTHNEHHHPSHRRRCRIHLAALAGQAHAAAPATFSTIKQINAGDLNVGYVDEGPANGPVVILLHGWPYDINSYVDVVPKLTAQGYRVIVPHLRGYGTTRFLDANTPRNGEPAALAADVIALMDALKIDKATLAGYDWGARTADIVAALWPQR